MLSEIAYQFHPDSLRLTKRFLEELSKEMKKRLQTSERTCALLQECNSMSLKRIFAENAKKSWPESLDLLRSRLTDIQF